MSHIVRMRLQALFDRGYEGKKAQEDKVGWLRGGGEGQRVPLGAAPPKLFPNHESRAFKA
jgi:hypothetical protein